MKNENQVRWKFCPFNRIKKSIISSFSFYGSDELGDTKNLFNIVYF